MPEVSAVTEPTRLERSGEIAPDPRGETFGHICRRCSRCCHHKDIHVNPYEVARLARRLGQTTSEFRIAWTRDGAGTSLRQTEGGACALLGPAGCTVHSDRPLVCRLYPLGRHVLPDGTEWFSRLELEPQTAGEIVDRGTIGEFLEAQQAEAFMTAADDYFRWFCAAQEGLGEDAPSGPSDQPAQDAACAADLVDMDAAIAGHCAATGMAEPDDIEDRKRLHLALLYREITRHTGGPHEKP
ncbi:MAG TPA: YkgJ family cysteine cluster protein [Xanthobacteraceae bacterium]|jgi:hypothetical protein|nr:YkgJ family cysteine cluster protein [Xanthobacteraceae bacterium]